MPVKINKNKPQFTIWQRKKNKKWEQDVAIVHMSISQKAEKLDRNCTYITNMNSNYKTHLIIGRKRFNIFNLSKRSVYCHVLVPSKLFHGDKKQKARNKSEATVRQMFFTVKVASHWKCIKPNHRFLISWHSRPFQNIKYF